MFTISILIIVSHSESCISLSSYHILPIGIWAVLRAVLRAVLWAVLRSLLLRLWAVPQTNSGNAIFLKLELISYLFILSNGIYKTSLYLTRVMGRQIQRNLYICSSQCSYFTMTYSYNFGVNSKKLDDEFTPIGGEGIDFPWNEIKCNLLRCENK